MHYISRYSSPLGQILLCADEMGLTGLWFMGQKYFAPGMDESWQERESALLSDAKGWLDAYFDRREPGVSLPLHLKGTVFQRSVWEILQAIPYGETRTYGQIAALLAKKQGLPHMSAQAVGGAVGRNPISIIVPCHRVVGAKGSLTGYAGGLDRKTALLALEGVEVSRFPGTRL